MSNQKIYKEPLLVGFLYKRKRTKSDRYLFDKWNRRWFCLRDEKILHFKKRFDVDPKDEIYLDTITSLREAPEVKEPNTFFIQLTDGNSVALRTDTKEEMVKWILTMQNAIESRHVKVYSEAGAEPTMEPDPQIKIESSSYRHHSHSSVLYNLGPTKEELRYFSRPSSSLAGRDNVHDSNKENDPTRGNSYQYHDNNRYNYRRSTYI